MIYYTINTKETLLKNILTYLVIHNNYDTAVYMEPIAYMKFQLNQFHMERYFIRQIIENFASMLAIMSLHFFKINN